MKVLFTADIHIKIGQKSVPRSWARDRYTKLFSELERVKREYNIDYEIHGGDVFDKLPNLEELGIYLNYISKQLNPIYIFDGNHEATKKGETFFDLLSDVLKSIHPNTHLITDYYHGEAFDVLPYCKLKEFEKKGWPLEYNKVLLTHVRGEIPPHVKPEVNLNLFKKWDIVFAGDLHSHSNTQKNIIYPGSPCTTSFHRTEVDTGVLVIDDQTMEWEWVKLDVPQLIRKKVKCDSEIVKTEYHHTIYELEGDAVDLAKVNKDSPLLDKKIVNHNSESILDLKGLTVEEELALYLKEVIALNEDKLIKAMGVYNDYITQIKMG